MDSAQVGSVIMPCFTFVYTTIYLANGPTSAVLPLKVGDLIQEYFLSSSRYSHFSFVPDLGPVNLGSVTPSSG